MLLIRKSLKFNLIKETMIRATSSFRIASMALISLALAGTVSSVPAYANKRADAAPVTSTVSQQGNLIVKGKVIDSTGQPVPGVAVLIQGTKTGTQTDLDGYYVINVHSVGTKLEFSSLGYKTQVQAVPKSLALDIFLQDDTQELDQAVVVGMGHQRKASVIGAISAVAKDELEVPQRNLTNALAGKVAGAVVVQRTGEPGMDNAEFWIRGISSLNSSAPLILVDGVERDMSNLAIEEIESISILKDASATAVYGVRAANGVVLVTTRKGIAQKPQIDVKIEGGISELTNMPELLDGANYMRLYNEAYGSTVFTPEQIAKTEARTDPYLYPNVNWFDEIFTRWSNNEQASVSIRGGGERARYYVTAAYIRDNGNLYDSPDTDYSTNIHIKRYNFRSNIDMNVTKSTILSLEIGANMTDAHQPRPVTANNNYQAQATQLFTMAYNLDPVSTPVRVPIGYNDDGSIKWAWGGSTGNGSRTYAFKKYHKIANH